MYDYLKNSIELLQYYEPLALQADPRGYCACSSFGKDSVALLEIFRQSGVKHFVRWNITGIDPPELVYFAREQCKKLEARGINVFAPKPDTDNLQKLLKDCMTARGFWKDDAQVASEICEKFWAERPGIYICVEELKGCGGS